MDIFEELFSSYLENNFETFKSLASEMPEILNERMVRGEPLLYDAVRSGNKRWVKTMLEAGADPLVNDNIGELPLAEALRNDDLPVIRLLVKYGADVNHVKNNDEKMEGLYIAIHHDDLNITKFLISKGARIFRFKQIIDNISSYEMVELLEKNLRIFDEEGKQYWEEQKLKLLTKKPRG